MTEVRLWTLNPCNPWGTGWRGRDINCTVMQLCLQFLNSEISYNSYWYHADDTSEHRSEGLLASRSTCTVVEHSSEHQPTAIVSLQHVEDINAVGNQSAEKGIQLCVIFHLFWTPAIQFRCTADVNKKAPLPTLITSSVMRTVYTCLKVDHHIFTVAMWLDVNTSLNCKWVRLRSRHEAQLMLRSPGDLETVVWGHWRSLKIVAFDRAYATSYKRSVWRKQSGTIASYLHSIWLPKSYWSCWVKCCI